MVSIWYNILVNKNILPPPAGAESEEIMKTMVELYRSIAAQLAGYALDIASWDYTGSKYDKYERDYLLDCFEQIILDSEAAYIFC